MADNEKAKQRKAGAMDTKQLEDAISRFGEMLQQYGKLKSLAAPLQDAVKESLLQRFEYTQEMAWKTAKRYLTEVQGYPDADKMGPNPVIRTCAELGLLDAEQWLKYARARQSISHDYSGAKALEVLGSIDEFHKEAQRFLGILQGRLIKAQNGARQVIVRRRR